MVSIAPASADGPVEWGQLILAIIVTVGSLAIFLGCIVLIYFLWRSVFRALLSMKTKEAEILCKLIGGIEIDANTEEKKLGKKGKIKFAGFGLLGTIAILLFGFLFANFALDFNFTNTQKQQINYDNINNLSEEDQAITKSLAARGFSVYASYNDNKYTVILKSSNGVENYHCYGSSLSEALLSAVNMVGKK